MILRSWLLVTLMAASFTAAYAAEEAVVLGLRAGQQLGGEPLFTADEQRILRRLGGERLAEARLVKFSSRQALTRAERRWRSAGVTLDPRVIEAKILGDADRSGDPLAKDQWGIHNRGLPQKIDLDFMLNQEIRGRPGQDINLPKDLRPPTRRIRVAVLDTGVDLTHPDLISVLSRRPSECRALEKYRQCQAFLSCRGGDEPLDKACPDLPPATIAAALRVSEAELADYRKKVFTCEQIWFDPKNPEVDQDGNGYPMDCQGWTTLQTASPERRPRVLGSPVLVPEGAGHGTHIAGIIGATVSNGIGGRGVAPGIEIIPVQVVREAPSEPIKPLSTELTADESGRQGPKQLADYVARAVIYAVAAGADVINMSLGWPRGNDTQLLREVVALAARRGVLFVAAAGNDATQALLRPCAYPGVICVGAHGPDGGVAHFSNYGNSVDLLAPGLNILSTWPMTVRPGRFRTGLGYEYLNGTSQAAAFVSGAAAVLLGQGVSVGEVRARLVAGASPTLDATAPMERVSERARPSRPIADPVAKPSRSGNLNIGNALAATPGPVFVLHDKDPVEIHWDRQSDRLEWRVAVTNLWRAVESSQIKLDAEIEGARVGLMRPRILTVRLEEAGAWASHETRHVRVTLSMPRNARLPSDLTMHLTVTAAGGKAQLLSPRAEIVVPIGPKTAANIGERLDLKGLSARPDNFLAVDLDPTDLRRWARYFAVQYGEDSWRYEVLEPSAARGAYEVTGRFQIALPKRADIAEEHFRFVLDVDGDGRSEYLLGLIEEQSRDRSKDPAASSLDLMVFSGDGTLQRTWKINGDQVVVPRLVQFMATDGGRVPAWVGVGRDPRKRPSLIERWRNPDDQEVPDVRFYFLDAAGALRVLDEHNGYRFVSLLEPTTEEAARGRVPVLMAKNTGTTLKPSFLFEFARAQVERGEVTRFEPLGREGQYRQLLDAIRGPVLSLDPRISGSNGAFWFGEGRDRSQRISLLLNGAEDLTDVVATPVRADVDGVLWVRAMFAGPGELSGFALTNSEIQFHDYRRNQTVWRSLERYTFIASRAVTNLHFPTIVADRSRPGTWVPALYLTESSDLTTAFKVIVPTYRDDGRPEELLVPAQLRLKAEGCEPIDVPVAPVDGRAPALDFFCVDHLIRVPLEL